MTATAPRLIFAGTPDFAVPSLQALLAAEGVLVAELHDRIDRRMDRVGARREARFDRRHP